MPNGEYEQEEEDPQSPYGIRDYDMIMDRTGLIDAQLNVDNVLNYIRDALLGYTTVEKDGKQVVEQTKRPLCNQNGADSILFMISTRLVAPVVLGNLTPEEAKKRAKGFELDLAQNLVLHVDDWEVEQNDLDIIFSIVDTIFVNFTRPIHGEAHKGLTTISRIQEIQQVVQRQESIPRKDTSFLSRFNGK